MDALHVINIWWTKYYKIIVGFSGRVVLLTELVFLEAQLFHIFSPVLYLLKGIKNTLQYASEVLI